jgi:hypothetical protein
MSKKITFSNSSNDSFPSLLASELLNCSIKSRSSYPGMSMPTTFNALLNSFNSIVPLPFKSSYF